MNPYVGACGGGGYPMMVGQQMQMQMAPNAFGLPTAQAFGQIFAPCPVGSGPIPAGMVSNVPGRPDCYRPADGSGGGDYNPGFGFDPRVPGFPGGGFDPRIPGGGGGGFDPRFPGGGYDPRVPWGGPCGPAVFPPGYLARATMGGLAGELAPQQPIGLTCGPIAGRIPPGTAQAEVLGETCEACCTSQGCFCVTDITVANCGLCNFLICSIKSGLCELIQCGAILADTFYCDCNHPPLKSSMLTPGIEFCIEVQNIVNVVAAAANGVPTAAEIALAVRTFYATVWGLPGDNNCEPCLY